MTPELKQMIEKGSVSVIEDANRIKGKKKKDKKSKTKLSSLFKNKTKESITKEIELSIMIDEIMDNFNFENCHKAMQALNWTWVGKGVPSVQDLRSSAIERINSAIVGLSTVKYRNSDDSYYFSSSGGLKATVWKNKKGHVDGINLEFVLTSWDVSSDEINVTED